MLEPILKLPDDSLKVLSRLGFFSGYLMIARGLIMFKFL